MANKMLSRAAALLQPTMTAGWWLPARLYTASSSRSGYSARVIGHQLSLVRAAEASAHVIGNGAFAARRSRRESPRNAYAFPRS